MCIYSPVLVYMCIFNIFILEERDKGVDKVAQSVKAIATKLNKLSFIPGTHMVKEATGSSVLFSVHLHTVVHTHTYTHMHTHTPITHTTFLSLFQKERERIKQT